MSHNLLPGKIRSCIIRGVFIPRKSFKPIVNLSPGGQARVALMRFGLGLKPGVAQRLATDGAAFQACLNEISNPAALLIPDA